MEHIAAEYQKTALLVSMQKTACVLLHMASKIHNDSIVPMMVDTGFHFQEVLDLADKYEQMFGITIKRLKPNVTDVRALHDAHGTQPHLAQDGADACCEARKVQPMINELSNGYQARIGGLMRSENGKRGSVKAQSVDTRFSPNLTVYNPLYDWTNERIDEYIAEHKLPMLDLYDQGYASIGCHTCTTPLLPGETDPRSGRWRHLRTEEGAGKTYCAINLSDMPTQQDGSGI